MRNYLRIIAIQVFLLIFFNSQSQNIFPGSVGFGTDSRGAYAGDTLPTILYVDNLNDSGPGSFRDALNKSFPRIILFNVSGTVQLSMALILREPYLFIAGQSAPGKGVSVKGAPFIVRTHDVLIQDVRFRLGSRYPRQSDCVSFGGRNSTVYNVVFDRCSFAFGLDENIGILDVGPGITISNSIIAYGLLKMDHSCGLLAANSKEISLIRNIFAFNHDRNPNISGGSTRVEVLNNLVYNSASHAVYLGTRAGENNALRVLLENNLYITGPDNMNRYLLSVNANAPDTFDVFWKGNLTLYKNRIIENWRDQLFDKSGRFEPARERPFFPSIEYLFPAADLIGNLSQTAGARAQNRDALDSLVIENIKNISGRLIETEEELNVSLDVPVEYRQNQRFLPENLHKEDVKTGFTQLEIYLHGLL